MKAGELCVVDIPLDHHDATSLLTGVGERVEKTGVIGAVKAWLDDHKSFDAKPRHEAVILRQCSIRQRVVRLYDVRIAFGRPEDVHMHVPSTRRHPKARQGDSLGVAQW